ncbi:adenylosuccinate synthase [Membranihabitans marinus]|uniref:adenylosuccinate synthase n=1 Tax=Membranihabitans marinus TaxID=1227546 RepID=UPI001EFF8F04|nr:adenylosuccinate synthase [Membranihabitans marinus]
MSVDVILGLQWGDEGKGKIVDCLATDYELICRFQGGPNAGHTLIFDNKKYVLHTIPSGIFRENITNVIGAGVVIDPITLSKEIASVEAENIVVADRLRISNRAHFILPSHRLLDKASEMAKGKSKIGSTLKGIGPTYMDKTGRNGLRYGDFFSPNFMTKYNQLKEKHLGLYKMYPEVEFDLAAEEEQWFASLEEIRNIQQINAEYFINNAITKGQKILAEGAQGTMLDIEYGTYPFVTSSNTTTSGVCSGLGVSPQKIGDVIGITKAYCTRVGSGPFPTELFDGTGAKLQELGHEFGATTGRPRRCGWLDINQLKFSIMINGVNKLVLTKLDVLSSFETIKAATAYDIEGQTTYEMPYDLMDHEITPIYHDMPGWADDITAAKEMAELPEAARAYVDYIAAEAGCEVHIVSNGPGREQLIFNS